MKTKELTNYITLHKAGCDCARCSPFCRFGVKARGATIARELWEKLGRPSTIEGAHEAFNALLAGAA